VLPLSDNVQFCDIAELVADELMKEACNFSCTPFVHIEVASVNTGDINTEGVHPHLLTLENVTGSYCGCYHILLVLSTY
jgi:hypothetical protein